MPADTEVAWAAGLFEGEGTWHRTRACNATAALAMADRDVVERFAAVVECGSITLVNRAQENWSDMYCWRVQDTGNVRRLIRLFMPYLGERRRAKAEEILGGTENFGQRGRSKYATHCIHGHPFDETNTLRNSVTGTRICRACKNGRRRSLLVQPTSLN